jgi:hypothetical protein
MRQGIFYAATESRDTYFLSAHPNATTPKTSHLFVAGIRCCPNHECQGLVFCIFENGLPIYTAPPEVMDFDASGLPHRLAATLEEAVKCHAISCFRAAALLVRRLLEEICEDKAATGRDLKARLKALSSSVIIPPELLEAADHLRLLGNDAAHIEAKTYDNIGKEEVTLAIELTKEILKGVYQYSGLLGRLKSLKKP